MCNGRRPSGGEFGIGDREFYHSEEEEPPQKHGNTQYQLVYLVEVQHPLQ